MSNSSCSPLQQAIKQANAQGRHAVIPFITAGFPDRDAFWEKLAQIDAAGADIIEIGVPFSDPVADGPVIEKASREVLTHGITLQWIIDGLLERKGQFSAKIVLMGYANPFYQYGVERLADDAKQAGISGFIVPDVPLEESDIFRVPFDKRGLDLITLVAPNTTKERMLQYKPLAHGFVYIVSVLGTTGGKAQLAQSVADTIRRAREVFDIPFALGFGLLVPEQLDALPSDAQPDAAVLGTALLKHIAAGNSPETFLAPWVNVSK